MTLLAPISVGELFDKISILELKAEAITDPARQANIRRELAALDGLRRQEVVALPEFAAPVIVPATKSVPDMTWITLELPSESPAPAIVVVPGPANVSVAPLERLTPPVSVN